MSRKLIGFAVLSFLTFFALPGWGQTPALTGKQSCAAVSPETCRLAHQLGRGINMGNMLEAPREGDYGLRLEPRFIDKINGVFTTVRLPVRWSNHAAVTADASLDDFFAERVDNVLESLLSKGFNVILDMHGYSQLIGGKVAPNELPVDPAAVDERFVNIWRQVAARYKDRSPKLIFELYNEPSARLNAEIWNKLAADALAAVRASNPSRTVMIGASDYNSVRGLPLLRLPSDRNLVVSFHSYEPFFFTHQGVSYLPMPMPVGQKCCDAAQRKLIGDVFDTARAYSQKTGYPLHLGEFGSYGAADMASRETYTRIVRDQAEKRGIGWTYWEFGSSFGVYAPKTGDWVEPIRRALLE